MSMSVRTGVIRARDKTTDDFGMCMGIAIVSQDHQRLIEVMNGRKYDAWVLGDVDRVDEAWVGSRDRPVDEAVQGYQTILRRYSSSKQEIIKNTTRKIEDQSMQKMARLQK